MTDNNDIEIDNVESQCRGCLAFTTVAAGRGECARWKERRAIWPRVDPAFSCLLFRADPRKWKAVQWAMEVAQDRVSTKNDKRPDAEE